MTKDPSSDTYTATIPGSATAAGDVQYYITAKDPANNIAVTPAMDWETSPYVIDISGGVEFPLWILIIAIVIVILSIITLFILKKRIGGKGPAETKQEQNGAAEKGPDESKTEEESAKGKKRKKKAVKKLKVKPRE